MDYTDNFSLAQPESGSSNSGQAVNGNMDTIDLNLYGVQNPLCYEDEMLIYDDNILMWN
jgi:hypothetical protein